MGGTTNNTQQLPTQKFCCWSSPKGIQAHKSWVWASSLWTSIAKFHVKVKLSCNSRFKFKALTYPKKTYRTWNFININSWGLHLSNGAPHWDVQFCRPVQDRELDRLCWRPAKSRGFEVRGYCLSLPSSNGTSFPWKLMRRSKVPSWVLPYFLGLLL